MAIAVGKDGREFILSATDSTFALMGDTQEEDRRHIADLVVTRMQVCFRVSRCLKSERMICVFRTSAGRR